MKAFGVRRLAVLIALVALGAASLAYLQIHVPIKGTHLASADVTRYWPQSVSAALLVLVVDIMTVVYALHRWRSRS